MWVSYLTAARIKIFFKQSEKSTLLNCIGVCSIAAPFTFNEKMVMNHLTRNEGEALHNFLCKALKNPLDIEAFMTMAREHPLTILMKGIICH